MGVVMSFFGWWNVVVVEVWGRNIGLWVGSGGDVCKYVVLVVVEGDMLFCVVWGVEWRVCEGLVCYFCVLWVLSWDKSDIMVCMFVVVGYSMLERVKSGVEFVVVEFVLVVCIEVEWDVL